MYHLQTKEIDKLKLQFIDVANKLSLDTILQEKIIGKYSETHRYYHNLEHICNILDLIEEYHSDPEDYQDKIILQLAAIFHDIVYDPFYLNNEESSALYFRNEFYGDNEINSKVESIIIATRYNKETNYKKFDTLTSTFLKYDLHGFEKGLITLLENEKKIRKEYACFDWQIYKENRIKFLNDFVGSCPLISTDAKENIRLEIKYLENYTPSIAIYPGSFNPFHAGHLNILEKAEKIFDKVIVAIGDNPEKQFKAKNFQESPIEQLKYKQIDVYPGLLTEYIKSKPYPVTIIRGLRNTTDTQYELNQYRWLQELMPDIKVISIFCDKEYEHISSTALRMLEKYPNSTSEKYIIK